jgi:hypothetical protein
MNKAIATPLKDRAPLSAPQVKLLTLIGSVQWLTEFSALMAGALIRRDLARLKTHKNVTTLHITAAGRKALKSLSKRAA